MTAFDPTRIVQPGVFPVAVLLLVAERAETTDWGEQTVRVAALQSLVGFKRLAGRPQDGTDLTELEAIYGELPVEPIPGLDTDT